MKQKRNASEIKSELWRRGEIGWRYKPIQKRLITAYHACKSFLFISLIARQTGKSFSWACLAIETCIKKPNARVRYGTAFLSDVAEFIVPIINTILEDCPSDVMPKYHKQGTKYVFKNGSEIKLVGLDMHPNGLRGNALDLVIIDEAGFVSKLRYIYASIILPMLRNRPHLRVVMSSTPPETPDHDFTEFVHESAEQGNLFKATIDDDETVTQETKDMLAREAGGKDSTTYRREFMVEFVTDSDLAIVPEWKIEMEREHPRDEFFKYYHRYVALDTGVVDYTAALFGYYDFKKAVLVIEDEIGIKGPQLTTDKLAKMIKDKEHELWGEGDKWNPKLVYRRIADNDNLILINDLGILHDCHFRATDKDELPAMVNDLRIMVKSNRVVVNPKCEMLKGCLRYGIFNESKVKREFARSKVFGHYDWLAAMIYLNRNLDTNSNPIPGDLGVAWQTHQIREDKSLTKTQEAFAQMVPKAFVKREFRQ